MNLVNTIAHLKVLYLGFWLTLIKHKNTIRCLQIFKKHAKLTYLFIWKACYSPLKMCIPARNVCVCYGLWNPSTASLPNCISAPGLPVGVKHSVFNLFHLHVRSFLLVSSIWQPVCASSLRRRGWVKKNVSNILNLDCQSYIQHL